MQIESFEPKLDFDSVLILPKRSDLASRKDVELTRQFTFRNSRESWSGIPIMSSNMTSVTTLPIAVALGKLALFSCLPKRTKPQVFIRQYLPGYLNRERFAWTCGLDEDYYKQFLDLQKQLISNKHQPIKFLCLDVANGYTTKFRDFVKRVREDSPGLTIIAGNVATPDMVAELLLSGADIVKVGIGQGSHCTTRLQTGIGVPQLSCVIECSDAAHGLNGQIISDGGCSNPGDVAKAFGGGADYVMLGGMFANHSENRGNGTSYGESSTTAMEEIGGIGDYRSSEGRIVRLPAKGDVSETVQEILGGLRSTCAYVGATKLKHLSKCTTFIRVNSTHNRVFEEFTIGS